VSLREKKRDIMWVVGEGMLRGPSLKKGVLAKTTEGADSCKRRKLWYRGGGVNWGGGERGGYQQGDSLQLRTPLFVKTPGKNNPQKKEGHASFHLITIRAMYFRPRELNLGRRNAK